LRYRQIRYLSNKNMVRIFAITTLLLTTFYCSAQIKATTDDGRLVLLYKNGTWVYSDTTKTKADTLIIAADKEIKTEPIQLYFEESRQLSRYFADQKSKIRCKGVFVIAQSKVSLQLQWEIPVSAGYKYFGRLYEGQVITFIDANNTRIDIQLNNQVEFVPSEKYEFSVLKGTAVLSSQQVHALLSNPISSMEVNWKKGAEAYSLSDSEFFTKNLKPLLNE